MFVIQPLKHVFLVLPTLFIKPQTGNLISFVILFPEDFSKKGLGATSQFYSHVYFLRMPQGLPNDDGPGSRGIVGRGRSVREGRHARSEGGFAYLVMKYAFP